MDPITSQVVFVSDSHIRHTGDDRHNLLIEVLQKIDVDQVEAFVLMGDIFDFFFAASKYFDQKFKAIFDELDSLAVRGVKVIFVQGNHEFSLKELKWKNIEVRDSKIHSLQLSSGEKLLLTHGDKLFHDPYYDIFTKITRSAIFKLAALCVPQKILDQIILHMAKKSRAKDEYRTLNHEKLLALANGWVDASSCTHMVFGHFHHPYLEARKSKDGMIASFHSWDKPNLLLYEAGVFKHHYL